MTGTELHRLAEGEGTLYVDGVPLGGVRDFTVGLETAAEELTLAGFPMKAGDVARALGLPVELVACHVPRCTSRETMHHHHRAVSMERGPLACRCAHPYAR